MNDKVLAHQFFVVRFSRVRRDYIVGLLEPFAVTAESLPFLTKVGFA